MKLDDFLKPKKVRCINSDNCSYLTNGKHYDVIGATGATYGLLKVHNDNGDNIWYDMNCFELVIESAENPLQNIELTPRFKVGDKVYYRAYADICVVSDVSDLGEVQIKGWGEDYYNSRYFCHATQENYEMLCNLYPHIEFEQPIKELKGSDLCFKKLKSVKKLVICAVSDLSDEKAIKRLEYGDGCIRIIKDCDPTLYHFIDTNGIRHGFAVPLNDETGEPLTESVLND